MQKKPLVSIHQIIIFVVFVSVALITSLFIFHLRHKPMQTQLANDAGMIFPAARDIKPFELVTAGNNKFTEKNFYQHWTLLFFGFTHCSSVCPTTLDMMKRAYAKLHAQYPNLQVVLISVDPNRDTPASLATYTHSFHPDFIGVTGNIQELRKLQSQLGIFAVRDNGAEGNAYQIQHTSSILLINPQGKWAGIYKFGLTPDALAKSVEESIKALS